VRVLATAGHVDHGKSTLVRALTGVDPDRLAEEKARGLTIDLGFAATTLPSGTEVAFVDVPGHIRFIKNMLAGVGAVDSCLLVVAATEGWKPQSEEHLRILDVLGLSGGVIAVTMAGKVDAAPATVEATERVAGTFLEGATVVAVDGISGEGLDVLRAALDRLIATMPPAPDQGRPRLWVDRSFPVRGAGTVVTGTLAGGAVAVGDEVMVEPGHLGARIRHLQSHGHDLERAEPGRRLAVNLSGISHQQVARGQAMVRPGQWQRTELFDASLRVLPGVAHRVTRRGAYMAYIGSGEFAVQLRVVGPASSIAPGEEAPVRLRLPAGVALPLVPGDRFVVREVGRAETIGGGEILDVEPVLPATRAAPDRSVARVVAERGWVTSEDLRRLTGEIAEPTLGRWVVDPPVLAAAAADATAAVASAGDAGLDLARVDERTRAVVASLASLTSLASLAEVVIRGGRAYPRTDSPADISLGAAEALAALEAEPWSPPDLPVEARALLRDLERRHLAVQAGPVWFATSAVDAAAVVVAGLLAEEAGGVTVGAVRDALGTSRKHVVPLLEHLDATGVTRRRGALRVAGPRLPTP